MNLNLLDWIVLLILVVSVVLSLFKGFVRELLTLASLVLAILLGVSFYRYASGPFKEIVKTENIALFLGFVIVFLGTMLAGAIVIWVAQKLIKFAKIQWFDRLLGAGFGFVRGWILGAIVFLVLTSFDLQAERVKNSRLAPYFMPGARVIALAAPQDLKTRFWDGYRVVDTWWREHI
jgi:membrane protein required for colicin V production